MSSKLLIKRQHFIIDYRNQKKLVYIEQQETFLAANSSCKPPMSDPRIGQIYPNDPLDCGSLRPAHSAALSVILFMALQLLI